MIHFNDVIGSTLSDHTHKGGRQAGNKSMLSYRSDVGIPGYTGYIAGNYSVPVQTKTAPSTHTGRMPDTKTKTETTLASQDTHQISEYRKRYTAEPGSFKPPRREGGGYWISQRALTETPQFIQQSTYRSEVCEAAATAAQQMAAVDGVSCTVALTEAGRRARSAEPSARLAATTVHGTVLGHQTTYGSMPRQGSIVGSTRWTARPATHGGEQRRFTVMPPAMEPRLDGRTLYHVDFGVECGDPAARTARSQYDMTGTASTINLAAGTCRTTHHPPGYTGFVPASEYSGVAGEHANGDCARKDSKVGMLLMDLDQYSRTRLPHYTGFKPQHHSNATLEQPSQGPTKVTTKGAAELFHTWKPPAAVDNSHFIDSHKGTMGFFGNGGGATVSDNGLSDAQRFYMSLRPLEGRPRATIASKVTVYGAKFSATSSLVP